eukprot:NODE_7537_length_767_cov_29.302795_g6925_i0.p1 GENE.NODE_7537_length_767_cov_29.302795_g6925_i0~~NODE_7537_length_767_cov_29.302795_g6925_i0.p1  ORF type:complete len:117 (-),score=13.10 NODE_7537_length_767_cov_29.302795_g6925_i0:77-427(-)
MIFLSPKCCATLQRSRIFFNFRLDAYDTTIKQSRDRRSIDDSREIALYTDDDIDDYERRSRLLEIQAKLAEREKTLALKEKRVLEMQKRQSEEDRIEREVQRRLQERLKNVQRSWK